MSNNETLVPEDLGDPITVFRFRREDIQAAVSEGRLREYVQESCALAAEDALTFIEDEIAEGRLP